MSPPEAPVLEVRDLRVSFQMERGEARAVDGVSFALHRGRTLAVVGESGSGKSVTAMALLRLVPTPPGLYKGGQVLFGGRDLLTLPEPALRHIRGNRIAMIFQEPMTSLNPVYTVGEQIAEVLRLHQGLGRAEARARAVQALEGVRIPDAARRADEYPHQLSGGMRQRVMIAMALACEPDVLIADEPTTALDVTIQAQILALIQELQEKTGAAVLFITHDLGVVAEVADEVVVMYGGQVVERGSAQDLFEAPRHPYTQGLLRARPETAQGGRLLEIPGAVPSALAFPTGCRFRRRELAGADPQASTCPAADARCAAEAPALAAVAPGHEVACHAVAEGRGWSWPS